MIPPPFTVSRQIIYIILNPTYFTALCPPLKPIRSLSPEAEPGLSPILCSSPSPGTGVAPSSCTAPQGSEGSRAGTPGSGQKDAKGKRRKRRWQGVELLLLQGLGARAACPPARWTIGTPARTGKGKVPLGSGSQAPGGLHGQGLRGEAGL